MKVDFYVYLNLKLIGEYLFELVIIKWFDILKADLLDLPWQVVAARYEPTSPCGLKAEYNGLKFQIWSVVRKIEGGSSRLKNELLGAKWNEELV